MSILEAFGTLVGLVYLWLEYKASIHLWLAGIVMPAVYLVVYYQAGLYADFGINVYYLLAAVYGWSMWRYGGFIRRRVLRSQKANEQKTVEALPITHVSLRQLAAALLTFVLLLLLIAAVLIRFTDSDVPWLDSFTTALSFVGMWMLARKFVEQWIVWIVVDMVSAGLYVYKGLYLTAALYALYVIIAIFGYMKWKRLMMEQR